MKTTLNKAVTPNNKTLSVGTLTEIRSAIKAAADAAANIAPGEQEAREKYFKDIADAQEAQKAAAKAKEEATTEAEFNKACDDESHARDKESFYKRQIDRLDFTPRMDEAEYYKHVEAVKAEVEKAAADFRAIAEKAVDELAAAKELYMNTAAEADEALSALDKAANVLQSKYRYKTSYYQNAPSIQTEDRNEWKAHAIRYTNNGKAYELAAKNGPDWDSKTCAAWRAADLGRTDY